MLDLTVVLEDKLKERTKLNFQPMKNRHVLRALCNSPNNSKRVVFCVQPELISAVWTQFTEFNYCTLKFWRYTSIFFQPTWGKCTHCHAKQGHIGPPATAVKWATFPGFSWQWTSGQFFIMWLFMALIASLVLSVGSYWAFFPLVWVLL